MSTSKTEVAYGTVALVILKRLPVACRSDATGGGIANDFFTADVKNTIFYNNQGGNCFGTIHDAGGNLSWGG